MKLSFALIGCFFGLAACQVSESVTVSTLSADKLEGYQQMVAEIEEACNFTESDECQIKLNEDQLARLEGIDGKTFHFIPTGYNNSSLERRGCLGIAFCYDNSCSNQYKEADLCYEGQVWESVRPQSVRVTNYKDTNYVVTVGKGLGSTFWAVRRRAITCIPLNEGEYLYWL